MAEHAPPHVDAPWINSPVLFISGPLRGKWIRFVSYSFQSASLELLRNCLIIFLTPINLYRPDAALRLRFDPSPMARGDIADLISVLMTALPTLANNLTTEPN
jgi:hypothetical protein